MDAICGSRWLFIAVFVVKQAKEQAKDLQKAFNELGEGVHKLSELWKEYGILLGAVSLGSLVEGTIELADQLDHLSKSYDITIEQTLAFRQALICVWPRVGYGFHQAFE